MSETTRLDVDARGLSCPEPLVLTKAGLEKSPAGIRILVDNYGTRQNVERFAAGLGYKVEKVEVIDGDYSLLVGR